MLCALVLAALASAAAACGRRPPAAPPSEASADSETNAGFLSPPSVTAARWSADGHVRVEGKARAAARVRLAAPGGAVLEAVAGPDGAWGVELPYDPQPRLFALSADAGGRVVRAEGALAVAPPPAALALIARSGAPSWPTPPAVSPVRTRLVTADFDQGGGFGVSGYARPGARVRLLLDGRPAGQGQADASGRFAVLGLTTSASAGAHRLELDVDGDGADAREVDVSPAPFLPAPYRVGRRGDAWRIDWRAPAGVIQSTWVFDPRPAGNLAKDLAGRGGNSGA